MKLHIKIKKRYFSGKKTQKCKKCLTPYHAPDTIGSSEIKKDQEENHDTVQRT